MTEWLHFHFSFHALEKEMATHSSGLAWRIPGTGEPGGLPSMGLHRIGYDWSNLAAAAVAAAAKIIYPQEEGNSKQKQRNLCFILTFWNSEYGSQTETSPPFPSSFTSAMDGKKCWVPIWKNSLLPQPTVGHSRSFTKWLQTIFWAYFSLFSLLLLTL